MKAKRIAVIDRELCSPKSCGMYLCQRVCPVNRQDENCVTVAETDRKPLIDESLCIGCGICVKKCPRNAIEVVNLPEELEETPIHRYGRNLFSLFRLPVPRSRSVVGLIGPNGTGKTTVLNILSGELRPNAGVFGGEVPWQEIMERFRGTELQDYIETLAKKSIRTGYKPQHVDMIPGKWKGKARDLLEKVNKKGTKEIASGLRMQEMLEKEIENLSGGELQLLAIAATLLKECDFYFFDEPSSYLDVEQRLRVAKEIRKLCEKAVVMVVEHDLAVADYLADYTHILYGKPGVFGVVSKPYGVRTGINTYLEGYIREENMRFRPEPVFFSKRARASGKDKLFLQFTGFEKKLGEFSVKTEPGNLYRGEIIGILGPNATGKTTFIRMLAGGLEPDRGESLGMKLSYKPQRIVLERGQEGMTIEEFLRESGDVSGAGSKTMLRFLGMERLLERRMSSLSGGELQSVFIAACLLEEHELVLMDEPSAFLDVEQRLRVAKLIREHAESKEIPCFIVDHDLQFMDAIADRIILFEGEPGVRGKANPVCMLGDGVNQFLKNLDITFRRDPHTGRPRANKPGSQKDVEQKGSGHYYYME
jgi:ATP-binding cassette subfamily E protein 1